MRRKDTKVYEGTVEKYCSTRHLVESNNKILKSSYDDMESAKAAYDALPNKDNKEITTWYNSYVGMLKMSTGMTENLNKGYSEELEWLEGALVYDYEEDLDRLYDEWLVKKHLK